MTDASEFQYGSDYPPQWSVHVEREVEGARFCYATWEITGAALTALEALTLGGPNEPIDEFIWFQRYVGFDAYLIRTFPPGISTEEIRIDLDSVQDELRRQLGDGELADAGIPDISNLPIPMLGSPPHDWKGLAELISAAGAGFIASGMAVADKPVIALVAGGGLTVFWFAKPHAKLIRDYSTGRLDRRLKMRILELDGEGESPEVHEGSDL